MSIHFGRRTSEDLASAQLGGRPAAASEEQLKAVVETLASSSRIAPGTAEPQSAAVLAAKVTVNSSEYDVRVKADGTFSARRTDGNVEIKLSHDTKTWGAPLLFSYRNKGAPEQSGDTPSPVVCERAKALGRAWFEAAGNKSLDL